MVAITELSALTLPKRALAVCKVTGDLTPEVNGYYWPHTIFQGKMSYRRSDGAYFIWWKVVGKWYITDEIDNLEPSYWLRIDPLIEGVYSPYSGAVGVATVTVYRFAPKEEAEVGLMAAYYYRSLMQGACKCKRM